MRVDPLVPRAEKITLVLEAIGDEKVRVNSASLDSRTKCNRAMRTGFARLCQAP